jgi:hypothetical protein
MSQLSHFEKVQQQQHIQTPDIRKWLNSLLGWNVAFFGNGNSQSHSPSILPRSLYDLTPSSFLARFSVAKAIPSSFAGRSSS